MRSSLRRLPILPGLMLAAFALIGTPVSAQTCTRATIASVIDTTSAELRKLNASHQPAIQGKIRRLAEQKGWNEATAAAKAGELLQDNETIAFDEQVSQLLTDLDVLGDESSTDQGSCDTRLAKLKTVSAQLIELTTAKAIHVSARLDAALGPQQPSASARTEPKTTARTEPKEQKEAKRTQPPAPAREATPDKGQAKGTAASSWDTDTVQHAAPHQPPRDVAELQLPPRLPDSADHEFTVDEIRSAGSGLFGSLSSSLAGVIEHAFRQYGRPNGYIVGTEGGGALLAGLRYGDGRLVTKMAGERQVYWQGPSLGSDFGVSGSRVMFLVYNLNDHEELFARFAGVDGSAYFVGGAGITFLKKGRLVLAPIRTGLGFRVGANIGYLKFTPKPSLNPF